MTNAYTPGPWKMEESNVFPKRITSDTSPMGFETHICEMVTVNDALFADAALIAAAPDLVQACRDLLARIERDAPALRGTQEAVNARDLLLRVAPASTGVVAIDQLFNSGGNDFSGFTK